MKATDFTGSSPGRVVEISPGLVAYLPNPLTDHTELSPDLCTLNEEALLALGELRAIIPTLPRPDLVTQPFLTREAVLSSRIEGTRTQVGQLYLFDEAASDDDRNKADPDEDEEKLDYREVRNYLVSLEFGLDQLKRRQITNSLLKQMHCELMRHVRGKDKDPGQYRQGQAFIGGDTIDVARYVAPPAIEIDLCMDQLEPHFSLDEQCRIPRLVQLAMVHYQFEAIHPFADGNGRLGRLLVTLMLSHLGILEEPLLYLSAYLEEHRERYSALLWEVSRSGAWQQWFAFFLEGIRSQAVDAVQRARGLLEYREECRKKIHDAGGRSVNDFKLLDQLFMRPVVSVNGACEILEVSYPSANDTVARLVDHDILAEQTGYARNRIFVAPHIIQRIQ